MSSPEGGSLAGGARLELLLQRADPSGAEYALTVWTPGATQVGRVTVDREGSISTVSDTPLPGFVERMVRGVLRGAARAAVTGRAWPRRFTRWRADERAADDASAGDS